MGFVRIVFREVHSPQQFETLMVDIIAAECTEEAQF